MATTRKAQFTKTAAASAAAAQPVDVQATEVQPTFAARVDEWLTAHLGSRGLSWQRNCIAFGVTLLASMGLGYAIGHAANFMMLGAFMAGHMVLPWVIFVVALVAAYYLGGIVGRYVYDFMVGMLRK